MSVLLNQGEYVIEWVAFFVLNATGIPLEGMTLVDDGFNVLAVSDQNGFINVSLDDEQTYYLFSFDQQEYLVKEIHPDNLTRFVIMYRMPVNRSVYPATVCVPEDGYEYNMTVYRVVHGSDHPVYRSVVRGCLSLDLNGSGVYKVSVSNGSHYDYGYLFANDGDPVLSLTLHPERIPEHEVVLRYHVYDLYDRHNLTGCTLRPEPGVYAAGVYWLEVSCPGYEEFGMEYPLFTNKTVHIPMDRPVELTVTCPDRFYLDGRMYLTDDPLPLNGSRTVRTTQGVHVITCGNQTMMLNIDHDVELNFSTDDSMDDEDDSEPEDSLNPSDDVGGDNFTRLSLAINNLHLAMLDLFNKSVVAILVILLILLFVYLILRCMKKKE